MRWDGNSRRKKAEEEQSKFLESSGPRVREEPLTAKNAKKVREGRKDVLEEDIRHELCGAFANFAVKGLVFFGTPAEDHVLGSGTAFDRNEGEENPRSTRRPADERTDGNFTNF